jgi:hypothetical protein
MNWIAVIALCACLLGIVQSGLVLIMTMPQDGSGAYSVRTVIVIEWVAFVTLILLSGLFSTCVTLIDSLNG